ncbi:MAG: DUF2183 domain-containing protein [Cyclobacteriaceae bacterium]|nr:DUF2183 domain-containing protein [Cyclobacteriaceae bacterium]
MTKTKIVGYRGIANDEKVIISGHAFEKNKVKLVEEGHGRRKNFRQTIRRFRVRPVKLTVVDVTVNGTTNRVRTNNKGFFTCELTHNGLEPGWHSYELYWKRNDQRFQGEFYLSGSHETGVISDIDDTLLVSHSTRFLRKVSLQLFKNAHSRKTIPMLDHWLEYLKDMNDSSHPRDFFYVSNSEWNLYDFLIDFFSIKNLPKGVFFLQNLKRGFKDLVSSGKTHGSHKMDSIAFLLRFYPDKKFILVGDSGQKDMEIYHEVVSQFTDRIKGVMIRKLHYIKNDKLILGYKDKFTEFKVPFITFQ